MKAGGCATKQMGFGKREEKRKKKMTSDRVKRVNINQNVIPAYRVV